MTSDRHFVWWLAGAKHTPIHYWYGLLYLGCGYEHGAGDEWEEWCYFNNPMGDGTVAYQWKK